MIERFSKADVYTKLETVIKKEIERSTREGGGSAVEARVFIALATAENLKDFAEKNIKLTFDFINGKTKELIVYIPRSRLPKGLIPPSLNLNSDEISLESALSLFGANRGGPISLDQLSSLGLQATLLWISSLILLAVILFLIYKTVEGGKRLTPVGIALVFAGITTLLIVGAATVINTNLAKDLIGGEPAEILLGTLGPPLLEGILKLWLYLGIAAALIGIVFFFVKKGLRVKKT